MNRIIYCRDYFNKNTIFIDWEAMSAMKSQTAFLTNGTRDSLSHFFEILSLVNPEIIDWSYFWEDVSGSLFPDPEMVKQEVVDWQYEMGS